MKLLHFIAAALAAGCPRLSALIISDVGVTFTENIDSLASSGTSGTTLPADWFSVESGTNADSTYGVGTGSSNVGNTYSFGATGSSERALGGLRSGTLIPLLGIRITNGTGGVIDSLNIGYTGEQWRLGALGREDRLDVQFSFDATSLADGLWSELDDLDFISPVTTGSTGALDGNLSGNQLSLSTSFTSLALAEGASIWLRWLDFDAPGADDGLAIDDFSVTAIRNPVTPPSSAVPDVFSTLAGFAVALVALLVCRRREYVDPTTA